MTWPPIKRPRFERLGMLDVWESVYEFESDSAHSSLQSLVSRHFELKDGRLELALYKERSLEDCVGRLDSTSAILLDATQKIHDRYNSGPKKEVIVLGEEFEKVRLTYS